MENIDFNKQFEIKFTVPNVEFNFYQIDNEIIMLDIQFFYDDLNSALERFGFLPSIDEVELNYSSVNPYPKPELLPFLPKGYNYDLWIYFDSNDFRILYQFTDVTISSCKSLLLRLIQKGYIINHVIQGQAFEFSSIRM